ncbi:MAG: hypothetical protein KF773_11470 [Deltaproteobacteria bacterium]|nr:hypothetical protein [Deltaproteobacteria bacterium]MCW5807761.1 hypothetical protein [Deltaproteobacteria bacterium]
MARAAHVLAATTVLGFGLSTYLYLDNRSLRADRDRPAPVAVAEPAAKAPAGEAPADPWNDAVKQNRDATPRFATTPQPALPEEQKESRGERRQRRMEEFGARWGRGPNETDEEYRARVMPLIKLGLSMPRERVNEMRKEAETKAGVTAEQSAQLDKAFEKVYDDVLAYTNKAIQDGQLSPYERNVPGWLDFAGGLGGFLTDAQGQVGKILSPTQLRAMTDAGFEWGEYLGLNAPWENLRPPPPPKPKT